MNRQAARAQEKLQRRLRSEIPILEAKAPTSGHLLASGAMVATDVGIAKNHADVLTAAGNPLPPPVRCNLLIDTGASQSLVRHDIAIRAGLKLINSNRPIHGIGVDTSGRVYLGSVRFGFPSNKAKGTVHQIWINTEIASGSLPAGGIDGLIGRDVLSHFEFVYQGRGGGFTLRYLGPKT